ncbi:MAG: c-type cytochrome biogenesis protein CcmI [Burkholderiales bacterium]
MIAFVLLSLALIAGVLLLVLLPVLRHRAAPASGSAAAVNIGIYRDQLRELDEDLATGTIDRERHAEARGELERRLLEDAGSMPAAAATAAPKTARRTAIALAAMVPVAAVSLYLVTGNPDGIARPAMTAGRGAGHDITPQQVEEMIGKLAARLKESPGDGEGWVVLGRSYAALDRYKEAADAYAQAAARIPGSAQVLVDYADVLAMAQGRKLAGEPEKLVRRALEIDPGHPKALAMAGTVAFENKQYATAVAHWQKLAAALPPGSEIAAAVQGSIDEARALGGIKPQAAAPAIKQSTPAAASVGGTVRLADSLKSKAAPGDSLFIFARAKDGPPAPLAVLRKRVADLPVKFTLDDSMAMAPGMTLSRFGTVILGARISKSGNAVRQPGDIEGYSKAVSTGTTGIEIIIDTEVR